MKTAAANPNSYDHTFSDSRELALALQISQSRLTAMFGLSPENIVSRVRASDSTPRVPALGESMLRGTVGFTVVSLGGFAPWIFASRWFYQYLGEAGLYTVCAIAFIGLSGLLLHQLIIGPGSLVRFYKIFSLAFLLYAIAWIAGWMILHGHLGSIIGLFAGTAAMGTTLAHAFAAHRQFLPVIIALFLTNLAGYYIGDWAHAFVFRDALHTGTSQASRAMFAKATWGLFYGLGFGAGIGLAFYLCQTKVRQLLDSNDSSTTIR